MKENIVLRYNLLGVLFGLCFPIVSSLILLYEQSLPPTLGNFILIHRTNLIQWFAWTVPFVMGALSYLLASRYVRISELERSLDSREQERDQLVDRLEGLSAGAALESQRRVTQLQTAAQVAQQANTIRDLEQLLDQTTRLISERFGIYHAGIFLNDEHDQYAVLQAANSEGGKKMLAREHKLKIGEVGIVGYVTARGEPRIALDVGEDAVFFSNPDLPETRSEMALPIQIAGKTIGALDLQTTVPAAFDENDITVLQIIADSLGSAIQNARLFSELQSSLEEIRTLHRQYLERAWGEVLADQQSLAYTFEPAAALGSPAPADLRTIQVPIKLREQVIGNLTLEADPRQDLASLTMPDELSPDELPLRSWTPEELTLIEAVATQAALALENARLLEETQRRAEQERIRASISGKLWGSTDVDTILSTALQELGASLGASEGLIQLDIQAGAGQLQQGDLADRQESEA